MEILQEDNGQKGRFFVRMDDVVVAEMLYKWHDSYVDIYHTEVSDTLKGQGVGSKLLTAAVNWARERHIKVGATCPFAKAILEKKKEYEDVYYVEPV